LEIVYYKITNNPRRFRDRGWFFIFVLSDDQLGAQAALLPVVAAAVPSPKPEDGVAVSSFVLHSSGALLKAAQIVVKKPCCERSDST